MISLRKNLILGGVVGALILFSYFVPVVHNNANYVVFSGSSQRCEVKHERKLSLNAYLKQLLPSNSTPHERLVDVIGYFGNQTSIGVGYEIAPGLILTVDHVVHPPTKTESVRYVVGHHIRGQGTAFPVSADKERDLALLAISKTGSYRMIGEDSTRIRKDALKHEGAVKGVKLRHVDNGTHFTPFEREKEEIKEGRSRYINEKEWPLDYFDRYTRTEELEVKEVREGDRIYVEGIDQVKRGNIQSRPGFSGSPLFDENGNLAGLLVGLENVTSSVGLKTEGGEVKHYRRFGYDVAANNTSIGDFLTNHCSREEH